MSRSARTLAVVLGGPLVVAAMAYALALVAQPGLPDPVATHWGADGADGFTSRRLAVPFTLLGAPVGMFVGGLVVSVAARAPGFRRLGGGLAVGLATFVGGVTAGSLWVQRGLTDAEQAPGVEPVLLVALVLALAAGVVAARLTPGADPAGAVAHGAVPADAPRLALGDGQTGAWTSWTVSGRLMAVVAVLTLVPLVALASFGVVPAFVLVLAAAVLALAGSTAACRVTVGRRGLTVTGLLGVPHFAVPLEHVAEAGTTQVDPLREFGGWGVRAAPGGRYGVVVRRGPALTVRRGDGTTFVVTVDGPDEAAALLNTLADRARAVRS